MDDHITNALANLDGELPTCQSLSEDEKDQLIKFLGYRTTLNIIKAKKDYSTKRIPFLFSSLDTQKVINVLGNDLQAALERAKPPK